MSCPRHVIEFSLTSRTYFDEDTGELVSVVTHFTQEYESGYWYYTQTTTEERSR